MRLEWLAKNIIYRRGDCDVAGQIGMDRLIAERIRLIIFQQVLEHSVCFKQARFMLAAEFFHNVQITRQQIKHTAAETVL